MSSMIDIARSGIMAYRTAMSVASENIANANTEGYVRRDVMLQASESSAMTPTTAAGYGQGVRVTDVRRAFDALTADRLRGSESALAAASVRVEAGTGLEQTFLPGAQGIDAALDGFFSDLSALASRPADIGLRRVAIASGSTVAARFSEAAAGLSALKEDALAVLKTGAQKVGSLLSDLASLNRQMIASKTPEGAVNPLHDQRDVLLKQLSQELEVKVDLGPAGQANVRLGPGPGGTVLLDAKGAAEVRMGAGLPPSLQVTKSGVTTNSTVLTGGRIGGMTAALAAVTAAEEELDQIARRLMSDLNAAHAAGIDLDGAPGGDLFRMDGVAVASGLTNRGSAAVRVEGGPLTQEIRLVHVAAQGEWQARATDGTVLASGTGQLTVAGVTLRLEGPARDGDSFTLTPRQGKAIDLRFVLADPRGLATALATVAGPAPGNQGTATASILPASRPPTGLTPLSGLIFPNPAEAISLIQPGVVGVIPAGTSSVSLASLGRQAAADFPVADADIAGGGTLRLDIAGTIHDVTLPAGLGASGLANALNSGALTTTDGATLAELGVRAGGTSGQFSLSLGSGDFTSASLLLASGTQTGLLTPSLERASSLQVFTRDGRQVSGPPLTAAEAAALLTEANGFAAGAQYRTEGLNGSGGTGYRGMDVQRQVVPGTESLTLTQLGGAAGTLALQSSSGTASLSIPAGASAARIADLVGEALPGLTAKATTAATLSGLSDGRVRFDLVGTNANPVAISADISGGDLSALGRAVNSASGATGITAELSEDGSRLMLRQADGATVRINGFAHDAGGTMSVTRGLADGQALGAPVLLGGVGGATTTAIAGSVNIAGPVAFSADFGGAALGSQPDAIAGNRIATTWSRAGDAVSIGFAADPLLDGAATSADGLTAQAASLSHQIDVNGQVYSFSGGSTPAAVAEGLLAEMRSAAPESVTTGTPVAVVPADGTALALRLDGRSYVLRMDGGAPVVEGPEAGRISASFDAGGQLRLTVAGGSPDGIGLRFDPTTPAAAAFGLGNGATQSLVGQEVDPANLPPGGEVLRITVGSTDYDILVENQSGSVGLTVPGGFPGTVTVGPDNRITVAGTLSNGTMRVASAAPESGFGVAGVQATVENGALSLVSVTGQPPVLNASVGGTAGERLTLNNLPPEDLIVVMAGQGALRLAGQVGPPTAPVVQRPVDLRVIDAATGEVELLDRATGDAIASGFLNAEGRASLGGYDIRLSGSAMSGDRFTMSPNTSPSGDARALQSLIALADAGPESAQGGFARILSELTSDIGSQLRASEQREQALSASHETLSRKMAEIGAVDLDQEAAKLIELQQAYQASAQALSIARQLFDTILNLM